MKPAIEVKGVWKAYHKGVDRRYKSLRDVLMQWPTQIWRDKQEQFWALQDISFDVEHGQSIGIIGRNGAGKSTLLKILSRITPPTKGEVVLRGRLASLLEVGTGFHPELTGRENIFFNGSILGMKYAETKRKLDEIVDFSGVESFIDTPLKHYSSGMQMRLAFSVAAHLDAEILLFDEVLSVGDIEFQKKCIGKMDEVSKGEGKTVVFVSHDMGMVEKLCNVGMVLSSGRNQTFSTIEKAILKYLQLIKTKIFPISFDGNLGRKINVYNITINEIYIDQFELDSIIPNQENVIEFYFETTEIFYFKVFFAIYVNGLRIFTLVDSKSFSLAGPRFNSKFVIPKNLLRPNLYTIGIGITDNFNNWSWSRDTFSFEISKSWINEENKDNFGIINIYSKSSRIIIE